jgi:hypothetical protein
MSETLADQADAGVSRTGVYLAILQLVITLGRTTYVIYLPKLAVISRRLRFRRMDERPGANLGILQHFDGDQIGSAIR